MKKVLFTLALVALMLPLRAQITNFPWEEGFENGTPGWTIIDSDGDGVCWQLSDTSSQIANFSAQYPRTGNACIIALSYNNIEGDYRALTPDEWLISPALQIPAGAEYTLTFYDNGTNPEYAAEHYAVHVATANTVAAMSATTALMEQTLSLGEWVKRTVDLSAYAGQTIYIGFHHFNCTDQFCMGIDDIRVGGAEAPEVSITGPTSVMLNTPATFVATGATTFTWYVDGEAQAETSNTLTYTFTTLNIHTVVASATNAAGTSSDTVNVNVYSCDAIVDFPFTEDFENGLSQCWTVYSANEANNLGCYEDQTAHDGSYDFRFSSYSRATNNDYNQYLITPELNMGENNYDLKFWYKARRATDTFYVKTSTTTNDFSAFTTLASVTTPATAWTEMVLSLPAGTKYVAINYNANYQYYLYIDDLYIGEPSAPSVSLVGPATIKAGNTAIYTATSSVNTFSWFVDNVAQSNTGNTFATSFTTPGNHTVVVGATNEIGTAYDTVVTDVYVCNAETLPFTADFTNGFGCWDTVSPTGTRWYLSEEVMDDPIGQVISISAQQSIFGLMDLGQDNWLISNEMAYTSGSYEIAWRPFAFGAPNYASDHYSVYVISGANFSDTTMVYSETLTAADTTFAIRVAAIPSTINGNFKIAFRHHDCVGGYAIALDNIKIQAPTAPEVTISGPANVMAGTSATFTANSGNATSYSWTVNGTAQSETSNTLTYTFTTRGTYTVSVTATNSVGTSAPASLTVSVFTCDTINEFPWNEGFESGLGCWTAVDYDGDGYNWLTTLEEDDFDASDFVNSGSSAALSHSYQNGNELYLALNPDNWLISPAITLPAGSATLSWYASGANSSYGDEHYAVYVSTGNSVSDFLGTTALFEDNTPYEWEIKSVNIPSQYAGQTIHVAFRHYNCTDMFVMGLDDVAITVGTTGIESANDANVAIFPNPVFNMLNIEGNNVKSVEVIDMNGRVVLNNDRAGQIDMSELSEGVYMVRVMSETGVSTKKIVKK